MEETVRARGHENVTARHASTFEVTSEGFLTPAGDCILGIEADRVPADFDRAFVEACRDPDAAITAPLAVDDGAGTVHTETITGRGHPDLAFDDGTSLVGRTSEYVDGRTVLVGAAGAAADVDRRMVDALALGADLTLTLAVER